MAHVKGRSKVRWNGFIGIETVAHRHRGGGGGAGAGLVDVDAGALEDAPERLVGPARRSARRSRAAGRRAEAEAEQLVASSSELVGGEARQLDGAVRRPRPARTASRPLARPSRRSAASSRRRTGSRIASSAYSKRAFDAHHLHRRRAPSNGAGSRVARTGAVHFAVEVLGVGEHEHLVVAESLEDARDHPARLLARPRVDRARESSGPGVADVERRSGSRSSRPRRATRPGRARGRRRRHRSRAASASERVVERRARRRPITPARIAISARVHARTATRRRRRRAVEQPQGEALAVVGGHTGSRAAPARARWPRTGP